MTMRVAVLRPEPGNSVTTAKLRALGLEVVQLPLFAVAPVAWTPPDPKDFDVLMLTSANAIRHGGAGLATVKDLPVLAVGAETADAARDAGFAVALTGTGDAAMLIAQTRAAGFARLLHLAGRERIAANGVMTVTVYASNARRVAPGATKAIEDSVALLHSPRAARRFAELVARDGSDRSRIAIAALSPAVLAAAGEGWNWAEAVAEPRDDALVALAHAHAIDHQHQPADKTIMDEELVPPPPTPEPAPPPFAAPRTRRSWQSNAVLLAIAFVAGLAVMAFAARHWNSWFAPAQTATTTPAGQTLTTAPQTTAPTVAVPPLDLVTLTTREGQLAAQLANLEARTAGITASAEAASGYATRAEGLMIAFAARRAIDRGLGLGYIESQLRARFGATQPRAVATVLQAAREPVTIEDLRIGLDGVAPQLSTGGPNGGWWRSLKREFGNLVVVHKADAPSPLPADRLTRARRMLEAGQVEAALAEVSRMPGASAAKGWTDAARHYVEARHALDALETAAVLGQAADTTPAPVPAG